MQKIAASVEKILGLFVGILMALLVLDVTWQVVSRFILNNPSSFTEEAALFLMLWISLLGSAYAYRRGAHLGLDILVQKLKGKERIYAHKISDLVCFLFAAVLLVFGGIKLVALNIALEQTSAAMEIKFWKVYSVIPISGVLFAFFSAERIIDGADFSSVDEHVLTD